MVEGHSYQSRLASFLDIYRSLSSDVEGGRPSKFKVCFVVERGDITSGRYDHTVLAMAKALSEEYDVSTITLEELLRQKNEQWFYAYHFVVGVGFLQGRVDAFLRAEENRWPRKWTNGKGLPQFRAFIIASGGGVENDGIDEIENEWEKSDWNSYDILYANSYVLVDKIEKACKATRGCGCHVLMAHGVDFEREIGQVESGAVELWTQWVEGLGIKRLVVAPGSGSEGRRGREEFGGEDDGVFTAFLVNGDSDVCESSHFKNTCNEGDNSTTILITKEDHWKVPILVFMAEQVELEGGISGGGEAGGGGGVISPEEMTSALSLMAPFNKKVKSLGLRGATLPQQDYVAELFDAFKRDPNTMAFSEVDYANMFAFGLSKCLCLGRALVELNVSMTGAEPDEEGRLVVRAGGTVEVSAETEGFVTGRDGCWCLFVNEKLVTCIRQEGLKIKLWFGGRGGRGTVRVDLRGNVYDNVIRRGKNAAIFVEEEEAGEGRGIGNRREENRGEWTKTKLIDVDAGDYLVTRS